MSIKSDGTNFLTITHIRIYLKMNQQSSRQRRSVPWWRTELRRQILKQRWEDWILLSCDLSDTRLRPETAWNWTSTDRFGNEGMYLCRGPSYGDKFQGGGERIDSYPSISLTQIWIQESSDNPREVIPTTAQYITATGKHALTLLQTAAPFIPVPLIKEAVDVALKIIEVCEVCKISHRKGCKMVNNILLPEYICRQWKGQRVER